MNSDFENQLQGQPMKKLPEGWRAEVLQAVAINQKKADRPHPGPLLQGEGESDPAGMAKWRGWLQQLIWPCPQAWAAVAAVWFGIFWLNFSAADHAPVMAVVSVPPSQEILVALRQQKMFKAELIGLAQPMEEPKRFIPQPRSELKTITICV